MKSLGSHSRKRLAKWTENIPFCLCCRFQRSHSQNWFIFICNLDADALIAGAPGAPMDVKCHDANRDYVIVTWKPPNTTSQSPVIGYFVDKYVNVGIYLILLPKACIYLTTKIPSYILDRLGSLAIFLQTTGAVGSLLC